MTITDRCDYCRVEMVNQLWKKAENFISINSRISEKLANQIGGVETTEKTLKNTFVDDFLMSRAEGIKHVSLMGFNKDI